MRSDEFDYELLHETVGRHLRIIQRVDKRNTWFWLGSYEHAVQKVKIEVSKREFPDRYVNKDFYGLTVPTMEPSCMFAHKLCAIIDRNKLQSRELYDAHFMFSKQFEIDEAIVKMRTGKAVEEYIGDLIPFVEQSVAESNVLEGLGELLSDQQKDSVRATLKRDLLFDLRSWGSNVEQHR